MGRGCWTAEVRGSWDGGRRGFEDVDGDGVGWGYWTGEGMVQMNAERERVLRAIRDK